MSASEKQQMAEWRAEQRQAARRDEEDLASAVRSLREAALRLRRDAGIMSDADYYARLDEAFDVLDAAPDDAADGYAELTDVQRAALVYQFISYDLSRCDRINSPLLPMAQAADWLTWWAIDGAAVALDKVRRFQEQPKRAAKGPRPGGRSLLLSRVVEMMRPHRIDRTTFKDFLAGWIQDGTREDISIEERVAGESYAVMDDRDTSSEPTTYTFGSLRTIYSTSVKDQRR